MSVDLGLLGDTAARCMDAIEDRYPDGDADLVAVGIVVVLECDDQTSTRTFCSVERYFEQLGLFHAGLECVQSGDVSASDEEDEGDE